MRFEHVNMFLEQQPLSARRHLSHQPQLGHQLSRLPDEGIARIGCWTLSALLALVTLRSPP